MKIALAFPGQGSQYIGMCKQMIEAFSIANSVFEEANDVLNFDIRSLILNGNLEELTMSENAQPAVVTASYALYRVFREQTNITPSCAVGHSLGEISALIAAGAMSFANGLLFARKRGEIMDRAIEERKGRAGIVVDLDVAVLKKIVSAISPIDYVTISGYNSPNQFIVAGHQTALFSLEKEVEKIGGQFIPFRMMPMKADAPYHSSLMTYLKPDIDEALRSVEFGKTNFDIWSTVTGEIIKPSDKIAEILSNQLIFPVYWNQVLKCISESGVDVIIDVGPNQIIRNLIKENLELPTSLAFDNQEDQKKILTYILGEAVN